MIGMHNNTATYNFVTNNMLNILKSQSTIESFNIVNDKNVVTVRVQQAPSLEIIKIN